MTENTPKKPRRKRRTKAEIEADKAAKAARAAEEVKMKEAGYEKTLAHDSKGHFVKDDPSTPENESVVWEKKPKEVKNDDVVVEMLEETAASAAPAKEVTAESAEPVHYEETPFNGMSKMRRKMMERRLRSDLR